MRTIGLLAGSGQPACHFSPPSQLPHEFFLPGRGSCLRSSLAAVLGAFLPVCSLYSHLSVIAQLVLACSKAFLMCSVVTLSFSSEDPANPRSDSSPQTGTSPAFIPATHRTDTLPSPLSVCKNPYPSTSLQTADPVSSTHESLLESYPLVHHFWTA